MDIEHENNITKRGSRKRTHTANVSTFIDNSKTPTRITEINNEVITTPVNTIKNQFLQTPRRSGRKSVKPVQDYDEIVVGRTLRSTKKEANPFELEEEEQTKWTPAKVGRVSQKRSKKSRKSKKVDRSINKERNTEYDKTFEAEKEEDSVLVDVSQAADALNTTFEKSIKEKDKIELTSNTIGANVENEVSKSEKLDDIHADAINTDLVEVKSMNNETKTVENISRFIVVDQTNDEFNDLNDDVFEEPEKDGNTSPQIKTVIQEKISCDEDQDMPSLILCDDDDDEGPEGSSKSLQAKGNDTFNTSDCIISEIMANASAPIPAQNGTPIQEKVDSPLIEAERKVKDIQAKYFTPNKVKRQLIPKIVVDFAQDTPEIGKVRKTPSLAVKTASSATPVSTVKRSPCDKSSPAKTKPGYRFPTPFKSNLNLNFTKIVKENATKTVTLFPMSKEPIITTLEPKEIVLRSIRKRSLSVTVECVRPKRKDQNVTFYSPANQTATIEELDKLMATVASKNKSNLSQNKRKTPRKRSISLDENALRCPSRLPRPVKIVTNLPKPATKPTLRTKIPNFAAIHEKQFQKMENLVEYVARKADRAQNLSNSALKARNATKSKSPRKIKPGIAKELKLAPSSVINDTADKFKENRVHHGAMLKGLGCLNDENKKDKTPSKSPRKTRPEIVKDPKLATSNLKNDAADKLKERRERHLAMFKSRGDIHDLRKKNCELIKGVRSNRHFELLMKHRKINDN